MTPTVDLEAEYNNRARVPEHPAIIEGWARDAAAYRAENPPVEIPYGSGEREVIDLFRPETDEVAATVMFIHGGYWQGLHRTFFSHLARGLNRRGAVVAVPSYDLCPGVRIATIIDQMRDACRELARFNRPLVVAGHSAGGHLAACMLATNWRALPDDRPLPSLDAAYAISGLFDLKPLIPTSVNRALGLDEAHAEIASPLGWPVREGLALEAVVGELESAEYHRQSRAIVDRWGDAGVATRYREIEGANHFTVVAPLTDPGSAMVSRLLELASC